MSKICLADRSVITALDRVKVENHCANAMAGKPAVVAAIEDSGTYAVLRGRFRLELWSLPEGDQARKLGGAMRALGLSGMVETTVLPSEATPLLLKEYRFAMRIEMNDRTSISLNAV